jgi:hypothetical protein
MTKRSKPAGVRIPLAQQFGIGAAITGLLYFAYRSESALACGPTQTMQLQTKLFQTDARPPRRVSGQPLEPMRGL